MLPVRVFTALLLLIVSGIVAGGQTNTPPAPAAPPIVPPPEEYKPAFPRLFPHPTGQSGYEDLVLAGDLLQSDRQLSALNFNTLPLSEKRRILDLPRIRQVLELIRGGVNRSMTFERGDIDENTVFPDLALMRALARLLAVRQEVLLADGQVGTALDCCFDTLRIGQAVQNSALLTGLVGIAVDAIALNGIARHLDQFSERDCIRCVQMVTDWLRQPTPALHVLNEERKTTLAMLEHARRDPKTLTDSVYVPDANDPDAEVPERSEIENMALTNPDAIVPLIDEAEALINARFDRAAALLQQPYWRQPPEEPGADAKKKLPLPDQLVDMLAVDPNVLPERYARDQAQQRLLGVHAAIRLYRWEHDRLPASLAVLRLGELADDPFSGETLIYKRLDATHYELYSLGYPKRDDDGKLTKERVHIYLPVQPR